jgi:hypothetical protein
MRRWGLDGLNITSISDEQLSEGLCLQWQYGNLNKICSDPLAKCDFGQ